MPDGTYELRIAPIDSAAVYAVPIKAPWSAGHAGAIRISWKNMLEKSTAATEATGKTVAGD